VLFVLLDVIAWFQRRDDAELARLISAGYIFAVAVSEEVEGGDGSLSEGQVRY
jgi:hypothetical protein